MCNVSNIRHKFFTEQCYLHYWWYFCVTLSSCSRDVVQLLEDEKRTVAGLCVPGSRTETMMMMLMMMTMMMMRRRLIMIMVVMIMREENSDDDECQKVRYRLKSNLQYWTLFCFSSILSKSSQFQTKSARLSSPQPKFPN